MFNLLYLISNCQLSILVGYIDVFLFSFKHGWLSKKFNRYSLKVDLSSGCSFYSLIESMVCMAIYCQSCGLYKTVMFAFMAWIVWFRLKASGESTISFSILIIIENETIKPFIIIYRQYFVSLDINSILLKVLLKIYNPSWKIK